MYVPYVCIRTYVCVYDDDDDEFVFAREVQFPHGAYKEKEKTKRKGTKETITKGHTPRKKIYGTCLVKAFL